MPPRSAASKGSSKKVDSNTKPGIIGRWELGPKVLLLIRTDYGHLVLRRSNSGASKTFKPVVLSDESVLDSVKTNTNSEAAAKVEAYVTARGWMTPSQAALARAEEDGL